MAYPLSEGWVTEGAVDRPFQINFASSKQRIVVEHSNWGNLASSHSVGVQSSEGSSMVIRLLGGFAIDFSDLQQDDATWHRVHARRLVQMVGSTREKVLQTLWPDFDEPRARNRLHHTVHLIRKGLENFPLAVRPQLIVDSLKVSLHLPPHAVVDVQRFTQCLEADASDDETRLANIQRALGWYRGDFAADWADTGEIASRRSWFSRLHEDALEEAVSLSVELQYFDQALKYAQRRAQMLESNIEAQCAYAILLAHHGRADVALEHCQAARLVFQNNGDEVPSKLDSVAREIQQNVNKDNAKRAEVSVPQRSHDVAVSRVVTGSAPRFAKSALPPRKPFFGYARALSAATQCSLYPHSSVVSLVGPPGAGKTALALQLAHNCQSNFLHGVLWVNCVGVGASVELLVSRMAEALCCEVNSLESASVQVVNCLRGKEMLVVLDGFEFGSTLSYALSFFLAANLDVRWLVTAWSSVNVPYEKTVLLDSTELMVSAQADRVPSAATQILTSMGSHSWSVSDKRIRRSIDSLIQAVDGLPSLLEDASRTLESVWPNELLAKLDRDPAALIFPVKSEAGPQRNNLVRWLQAAPLEAQRLLAIASHCRSWLTRLDLAMLMDADHPHEIDALIDHCANNHYLQRRVRQNHHESWSEFRVPKYCHAALLFCESALTSTQAHEQIERWLSASALHARAIPSNSIHGDTQWFDDRVEDVNAVIVRWHTGGRIADIATLCLAYASCWAGPDHSGRALEWLTLLGERMEGVEGEVAAKLLVKRARLRARFGQMHDAFNDASQAYARSEVSQDGETRQEAVRLIERYGKPRQDANAWPPVLSERGIDAGESLLRIAKLAILHGEPQRAMQLCSEAVVVLSYFGLVRGVLKAHQYRARIAFRMGDTDLALQCISQFERAARGMGELQEVACADLMRANVLLAEMQFGKAMELTADVLARAETASSPALVSRGLLTLGWAHFATGALPVLRAMSQGLIEQAHTCGDTSARKTAELLSVLVLAHQGQQHTALSRVGSVLDLVARGTPVCDTQSDLINAIDLVVHLGQPALAHSLIEALEAFGNQPDHRLRPWVGDRLRNLQKMLANQKATTELPSQVDTKQDHSLKSALQQLSQTEVAVAETSRPEWPTKLDARASVPRQPSLAQDFSI
jgi:DNA-binding SARP family transcriptional activator/RecA/RadA recombinase